MAGAFHAETFLVDQGVMVAAKQDAIGCVGVSAVLPMDDVMRIAPVNRAIASWEPAMSVASDQGLASWLRH